MIELKTGENETEFVMSREGEEANWTIVVIDKETGRSIDRARATLRGEVKYTNSEGVAYFQGIRKGTYPFVLIKEGYETIRDTVVYR